mmetsp:Transcript_37376/g.75428  ORF Transcript_37376/g.75428 Transcript_37376/m.75428 type:complete len:224 (+) Transcript_37376:67-738(+)
MAAGAGAAEAGQLVFQKSKKIQGECFIISVLDNATASQVRFSAFDLESSEAHALSYAYADFDALFQADQELADPAKKEERYDWIINRLDLAFEVGGASKRLILNSFPNDDRGPSSPSARPANSSRRQPSRERLTYAERVKLRQQADALEAKRTANASMRRERNRKAFVAELAEKRKLEELKQASRRQRIDEERSERREKAEMQKHLLMERTKRYEDRAVSGRT